MKRTSCSACGSTHLEMFLDLGLSPVADAYTATPQPVAKFALELAVCGGCRLVQLLEVLPDQLLFGTGYSFYSSASPPLSAYHAAYAQDVLAKYEELAGRLVVEVGCNDGDLLRHFAAEDCYAIGIDPAEGPVEVARERGLNVANEALTAVTGAETRETFGPAGIVIANHVLAHVADVNDFLLGLATMVDNDGIVMVEVQYLPDLFVNNAFDLVYHEHRNFFSLTSVETAARRVGLHVVDAELTSRQGGSLRVMLSKQLLRQTDRARAIFHSEEWLQDWGPYAGFQGRVERIKTRLLELVWAEQKRGIVVGFGAPAKATTLLNYCGIGLTMLSYVTDSTLAKQGRFIPGTGLQILDPLGIDEPADTYLLLSWNYAPEIMRGNVPFTTGGGRWIVPIPAPMML